MVLPLPAADLTHGTNLVNLCMGVFGMATGVGATLSTVAAGLAAERLGVGAAFVALAATGLLPVLSLLLAMPETLASERRPIVGERSREAA